MQTSATRSDLTLSPAVLDLLELALGAVGRAVLCVDRSGVILHAARSLDELLGPASSISVVGMRCNDLFGPCPAADPRSAVKEWTAAVRGMDGGARPIVVTRLPLEAAIGSATDPRIAALLMVGAAAPADRIGTTEEMRIRTALEVHRWRREEAARELGISRTTLWRKMREFGLL